MGGLHSEDMDTDKHPRKNSLSRGKTKAEGQRGTCSKVPRVRFGPGVVVGVCSPPWWVRRVLWAHDGVSSGTGGADCLAVWQRAETAGCRQGTRPRECRGGRRKRNQQGQLVHLCPPWSCPSATHRCQCRPPCEVTGNLWVGPAWQERRSLAPAAWGVAQMRP